MNERARKRWSCFWCDFRDRAQRFPRQQNWKSTCECALCSHPTSDFCRPRNNWVFSYTLNFSTIGQSVPEIRYDTIRYDVHCAATRPPTFVDFVTIGYLATRQILAQSVNWFPRYGNRVCTCARDRCPTKDLRETYGYWVPNHSSNFSTMRPVVLGIWKRSTHVRTCRCTLPMTCGKHVVNDPQPTHQI